MKSIRHNIHGILLLDKPLDISSNGALQYVKRLFKAKKAGHTGSLDPLATGMLPICFGEATKFSQYLLDSDKNYLVTATLGIRTATGDAEGSVIAEHSAENISRERFQEVMQTFQGEQQQIPPMYSAVKVQGQPLYELARRGIEIERKSRTVNIFDLRLIDFAEGRATLAVHCSKGTYIRTLVDDIGLALGCGAYVSVLHRTSVTPYQDMKMYRFAELEAIADQQAREACLLPIDSAIRSLPALELSASAVFYIRNGQSVMLPKLAERGMVRLMTPAGVFIGIGELNEDGRLLPKRLLES